MAVAYSVELRPRSVRILATFAAAIFFCFDLVNL